MNALASYDNVRIYAIRLFHKQCGSWGSEVDPVALSRYGVVHIAMLLILIFVWCCAHANVVDSYICGLSLIVLDLG